MPPLQLAAPTDGMPCTGSPLGSSATSGMPLEASFACCSAVKREWTEMTPVGRRARSWSAHDRLSVASGLTSANPADSWLSRATASTPRMISMARWLSSA
jgi:hypothetical protein